jgi:hypothetical protein
VVVAPQCLLVEALSADSARRLVAQLGGLQAVVAEDGADCVVVIELDRNNAGWLDGVLVALQKWLAESALATCRVRLDDRHYVYELE